MVIGGTGFRYGPELLDELTVTKVVHVEAAPQKARSRSKGVAEPPFPALGFE
jgi:hypothetical protein